ncbi:MAG: DUF58 domain-containing protein [Planctomycetes bacterium]|nr:DUF58 domain-containing protein [Planctomycetota bacterium]
MSQNSHSPTGEPRSFEEILSPEAKESLERLQLFARRIVEGMLHGIHTSRRIGISTDFDHHKEYQSGDPLKHMDWKASARHDRYYIKRYVEDTALNVRFVMDRSASMLRSTNEGPSKYDHACRVAAALAYLVLREKDSAGLILTSSEGTKWLPPSSRGDQLVVILSELVKSDPADRDNVAACLRTVLERGEKKGLVVAISDLMFDPGPAQQQLASLMAQGHEALVFQLRDPTEEDFPFNRWVQFENLEDPSVSHRVDAIPLKKIYREEYQSLTKSWRGWAKKHGAHFVTFRTDQSVETALSEYLRFRERVG